MSAKTDKPAAPKPANRAPQTEQASTRGNSSTATPVPENRMVTPSLVKVRAAGQPVGEPGGPYHKGQVFETTPERRKALGPLVENAPAE